MSECLFHQLPIISKQPLLLALRRWLLLCCAAPPLAPWLSSAAAASTRQCSALMADRPDGKVGEVDDACSGRFSADDGEEVLDVVVVGGGLSGLTVAAGLAAQGTKSWRLLEAHDTRLGGRLANTASGVDLGAAWLWPAHGQRRMAALLDDLDLKTFRQPDDRGGTTMRVHGGTYAIVDRLAARLPAELVVRGFPVTRIELLSPAEEAGDAGAAGGSDSRSGSDETGSAPVLLLTSACGTKRVRARHVVVAAPPQLVAERIEFVPTLPRDHAEAMDASRTWMAGVPETTCISGKYIYIYIRIY